MKKSLCFGEGGLASCTSWFIRPSKHIREKYLNCPKTHTIESFVLIAEAKNTIRRISSGSSVYRFLHADFEGVEFYPARRYVSLTKEIGEEYVFVSEKE